MTAAPTPCRARAPISVPASGASPHRPDATAKMAIPRGRPARPIAVAEESTGQQQHRKDQGVAVDDPLKGRDAAAEVLAQARQGHVDDVTSSWMSAKPRLVAAWLQFARSPRRVADVMGLNGLSSRGGPGPNSPGPDPTRHGAGRGTGATRMASMAGPHGCRRAGARARARRARGRALSIRGRRRSRRPLALPLNRTDLDGCPGCSRQRCGSPGHRQRTTRTPMTPRFSLSKDRIRVLLLEGINDSAVELCRAVRATPTSRG